MGDYGLKVSRAGYNVSTATNKQLVFSSKFNTLKLYAQGSGSQATGGGTVTIAHSLGYVPAFVVYSEREFYPAGDFYMMPDTRPIGGDVSITPFVGTTNLYIRFGADTTGLNYKYTIYTNRGSD